MKTPQEVAVMVPITCFRMFTVFHVTITERILKWRHRNDSTQTWICWRKNCTFQRLTVPLSWVSMSYHNSRRVRTPSLDDLLQILEGSWGSLMPCRLVWAQFDWRWQWTHPFLSFLWISTPTMFALPAYFFMMDDMSRNMLCNTQTWMLCLT